MRTPSPRPRLDDLALRAALLLGCLLAATACAWMGSSPTPTPSANPIRLAGDSAMSTVIQDLVAAYQEQNEHARLLVSADLRWDGIAAVRQGEAEIGLLAMDPPAEAAEDEGLAFTPIGLDALVVAVHAENTLQGLSLDALRRIYAGRVHRWAELGGSDLIIQIVGQPESANPRQVMEAKVMHGQETTLESVIAPNNEAVAEYLARHPGAIGYLTMAALRQGTKALALEGVQPSISAIRGGDYPLTMPLHLVTTATPSEEVHAFWPLP